MTLKTTSLEAGHKSAIPTYVYFVAATCIQMVEM